MLNFFIKKRICTVHRKSFEKIFKSKNTQIELESYHRTGHHVGKINEHTV